MDGAWLDISVPPLYLPHSRPRDYQPKPAKMVDFIPIVMRNWESIRMDEDLADGEIQGSPAQSGFGGDGPPSRVLKVHRAILASSSDYFLNCFTNCLNRDNPLQLLNLPFDEDVLEAVLDMCYADELTGALVLPDNFGPLCRAAEFLLMDGLCEALEETLMAAIQLPHIPHMRAFLKTVTFPAVQEVVDRLSEQSANF